MMALFDELNRAGNTIVLVTHEEDIAAHARRVVRLLDGRVSRTRAANRREVHDLDNLQIALAASAPTGCDRC